MSSTDDSLIGQVIDGRYRIDSVLGRGGMGAVYRAHQLGIGRDVAFKVLRGDKRQDAALQRFEAEARIIARLRHPHTVRLIDFGHLEDDLYLVLELIGGHPLNTLLARKAVPPALALELCAQIADALTEAHGLGIVHRDLKPANILVEPIGDREVARILDFGVARATDNTMTRDGAVMGTPAYMAPEQAQGLTAEGTADLYALGVILFEALAGERPFHADTHFALMMMHISSPPPPVTPKLPRGESWTEVGALVDALLAKDPADRPQSASEVRDRLRMLHARIVDAERAASGSVSSGAWPADGPGQTTLMPDDSVDGLAPAAPVTPGLASVRSSPASGADGALPAGRWYQAGDLIGDRYEVESLLGQGGFAAVYSAHDPVVGRKVAVKVLNESLDGPDPARAEQAAERFRREARSAAMIVHPNVVTIHDLGIGQRFSQPFIVMELLGGRDLGEELKASGPMAGSRAIPLLHGALLGLAAGHERGVVHKDLKPSNLFVVSPGTPDEKLCLFDFGIARLGGGETGSTGAGELYGTAQYLAPEYVSEGKVSPAVDVYQMGLILVEMLTGRRVVDIDVPISAALTHGSGSIPIPVELLRGPFGWVLRRALAHDPARRFPHAAAFAAALAAVEPGAVAAQAEGETTLLKNAPAPAGPDPLEGVEPADFAAALTGMARPRPGSGRRRWRVASLIALAALGLGAASLGDLLGTGEPEPSTPAAAVGEAARGEAPGAGEARAASPAEPVGAAHARVGGAPAGAEPATPPPDAATPDAGRPDASLPDAQPVAADPTEQLAELTAALKSDLGRCRCSRARARLAELRAAGGDGQADYDAACARLAGGRGPGLCGRAVLRRLEKAMSRCPCGGNDNKRLVELLARQYGVDRRQVWTRRCIIPGLPGGCAGK